MVDCVVSSRWEEDRTRSKRPLSPVSISTSRWPTTSLLRQPKAFTTNRNSSNWQLLSQVSCHSFSLSLVPPPIISINFWMTEEGKIFGAKWYNYASTITCVTENWLRSSGQSGHASQWVESPLLEHREMLLPMQVVISFLQWKQT